MLVPRTYRWDQYEYRRDDSLETVPRIDRIRPVAPGIHVDLPQTARGLKVEPVFSEDFFLRNPDIPSNWMIHYRERRTLWRPTHVSSVVSRPTKILSLTSSIKESPLHPLLEILSQQYQSHLTRYSLVAGEDHSVGSALKKVAEDVYDLIVIDRGNLDWASAILKEVSQPVLVLPSQWKVEGFPKKIMVPVDGTAFSYPALTQAVILGEDFGAQIQLFEVSEKRDQVLSHLIERMAWKNLAHDFFQTTGNISQAIVEFSKVQKTELIMMGTHGIQPGTSFPHSITLEVLRGIDLPLWVVHPETGS
jgi:nucleotide-binding universal stress UspA family protein